MISTGYFYKTKEYVEAGLVPVSIARVTPTFFKYHRWTVFAPPRYILNRFKMGDITEEEYTELYIEYLNNTITESILKKIHSLFYNKDIVMCCYEGPKGFCHRHILAEWLNKKLNLIITEVYIVQERRKIK